MSSIFNPSYFTDVLGTLFDRRSEPVTDLPNDTFPNLIEMLFSAKSEAQQTRTARAILLKYHKASKEERLEFFNYLSTDLDINPQALIHAATRYRETGDSKAYSVMVLAGEPARIRLFRLLANVRGGAKCLVKIREHVRRHVKTTPALGPLEQDLKRMLVAWFNRGFLVMRPITWQTSAQVLEKIIAYEAVHQIRDWDDLRRRLQPADRRCYAFFHPRMPDDPIIFVEVALTNDIPNSIEGVLAQDREEIEFEAIKTATFYSISNCHAGLAGISFGNALIKQVARDLAAELPQIQTYVTLSPIPGLSKASEQVPETDDDLLLQAAKYLAEWKREDGSPLDPVANFHLGNGAQLHRIQANANLSNEGQRQSFGAMVNYLYDLEKVEERAETFAVSKSVPLSAGVQSLLRPKRSRRKKEAKAAS